MGRRTAPHLLWLVTAVVAAATAYAALRRPADVRLSDLSVYVGAVNGLTDGAGLYDFIRGAAPFTYPPFAALVFLPLTWLPTLPLQVGWSLATIATVAGLAHLVTRSRAAAATSPGAATPTAHLVIRPRTAAATSPGAGTATAHLVTRPRAAAATSPTTRTAAARRAAGPAALALILMLSAPVSSDLKYGQVSLFLAAAVAVDLLALRRTPWHGALVGAAAAVKLTPLIFIPLLWCAGRRAAAVVATATFTGCGAVAAIVLPGDSWRFWTTEVFHVSRLGHITSVGNQSLNGALLRVDLSAPLRSALVLTIGGAIAALALRRATRAARAGDWLSATVVLGAASVVLSPVSWTHHQIWLVLAALLPVRGTTLARRAWATVVLAVMVLPVTALGPPLWSESRLLLAVAVAAVVPLALRPDATRHTTTRGTTTAPSARRPAATTHQSGARPG